MDLETGDVLLIDYDGDHFVVVCSGGLFDHVGNRWTPEEITQAWDSGRATILARGWKPTNQH